jgi:hypothetical protein
MLKKHKSTGSDQIPTELIQAGGGHYCLLSTKLINSTGNKEESPDQWEESVTLPVYEKGAMKLTLVIIMG